MFKKIIQIVLDDSHGGHGIIGLGDDGLPYIWNYENEIWDSLVTEKDGDA